MNVLRKGVVLFLSFILFISLLGGVWALDVNYNFSKPDKLKSWLKDSKIYDKAIASALSDAQNNQDKNGGDSSVSLKDPSVQAAAKQSFTPQLLENSANTFIDANYAWLQGKSKIPSFNINLANAKADFATRVGQNVQQRLAALPACTPAQLAQLQIPVDSFSVTCRPANLDPKTEGDRVHDEILNNQDFLGQPNITADNVNKQKDGSASSQPSDKPYYSKLSNAPKLYQFGQKAPFILEALAALSALGIAFISSTRRKGWRRTAVILTLAGVILLFSKFAADAAANALTKKPIQDSTAAQLKQPRDALIHTIESNIVKFDLLFGIIFLVLAVIIFVWLYRTKNGKPTLPVSGPPAGSPQDETREPAQSETPVRTPDELPRFRQPQPKPKRPPRLIQ